MVCQAIRDNDVKGLITSIKAIEDRAKTAREYIKRLGLSNFVNIVTGNTKSILPNLNRKFDIVFINGRKEEYHVYLKLCELIIRRGSLLIAHNIIAPKLYKINFLKRF